MGRGLPHPDTKGRRGRILEAVAFSAARLLQPGTWRAHADVVLARLGEATEATRIFIAEMEDGAGALSPFAFKFGWRANGGAVDFSDPRVRDGWQLARIGLGRMEQELRAGRPFVSLVRDLGELEQRPFRDLGSKSFAIVPIFAQGGLWGFLGFDETRHEREWPAPEVEALKAAAAVLGAAIERERADAALREARSASGGSRRPPSRASRSRSAARSSTETSRSRACSACRSAS
jgi:GAF domain-containing protein